MTKLSPECRARLKAATEAKEKAEIRSPYREVGWSNSRDNTDEIADTESVCGQAGDIRLPGSLGDGSRWHLKPKQTS